LAIPKTDIALCRINWRTDNDLAAVKQSRTLRYCPNLATLYMLMEEPDREKERNDTADPKCTRSKAEKQDPKRAHPNNEQLDPYRRNPRKLTLEPKAT
jgi:hypothetical protein